MCSSISKLAVEVSELGEGGLAGHVDFQQAVGLVEAPPARVGATCLVCRVPGADKEV